MDEFWRHKLSIVNQTKKKKRKYFLISLLWDTQNSHTDRCSKHIMGNHGLWNWGVRELLCNGCTVLVLDDDKFLYLENGDGGKIMCKVSVNFHSVAQSCQNLCDPMNCSTPGLPVHHQLPEFADSRPSSQWCIPAISSSVVPFSSCPQSLPAWKSFLMSQHFAWGGQSTGVSALASFLPTKSQGWSPSEWTGWISLQSKGLSRLFSNNKVQKY